MSAAARHVPCSADACHASTWMRRGVMFRFLRTTSIAIFGSALLLSSCSDNAAQAQNNQGTTAQIRESMGHAPASIDTTTAVRLSAAFRGAAERALPAVVHIRVTTGAERQPRQQRTLPFP